MSKTFNLYCDESTHLENDHMPYMIIGYIKCPYPKLKEYKQKIKEIKGKHQYKGEFKWSKISTKMESFYLDLVDFFFRSDLEFRAVIINKSQIDPDRPEFTHDDFYFKMYYQLLHNKMDLSDTYNVYLDIKDTCSFHKLHTLKTILKYNSSIRNFQFIRSHESYLMQLADVLIGAINYKLRVPSKVLSKNNLVKKIEALSPYKINSTTPKNSNKINFFFIDLK